MATKTWFGGTGSFNNPHDWSPSGVPQTGDQALLTTGTVKLRNQGLSGVNFSLQGTSQDAEPVLALRNVALNAAIEVNLANDVNPGFGEITVAGTAVSAGSIDLGGSRLPPAVLTVDLAPHSTFVNTGTIAQHGSSLLSMNVVRGSDDKALFINDGTVTTFDSDASFNLPVVGNGTFNLETSNGSASLAFHEGVSKGITVDEAGVGLGAVLRLDEPQQFLAAIQGLVPFAEIDLPQTQVTSETFANNELTLFGESGVLARLNIIGDFRTEQFSLRSNGQGTTVVFNDNPATVSQAVSAIGSSQTDMPMATLTDGSALPVMQNT